MSGDGRIPLWIAGTAPPPGQPGRALILTGDGAAPGYVPAGYVPAGYALVRHADAAATAQAGACTCCRGPAGLTLVLRQLFLDRVRGDLDGVDAVIVETSDAASVEAAMADPLVAARFRFAGAVPGG